MRNPPIVSGKFFILNKYIPLSIVFVFGLAFAGSSTNVAPVDLIACTILMVLIVIFLRSSEFREYIFSRDQFGLLFFIVLLVLSILFLPNNQLQYTITTLYCLSLFYIGRLINYFGLRKFFLYGLVLGGTLSALYTTTQVLFFTNNSPLAAIQGNRAIGLFSDPNVFGAFLVVTTLLSISLLVLSLEQKHTKGISLYAAASSILFLGLHFTGSRGAYIQFATALLYFIYTTHIWKRLSKQVLIYMSISFILLVCLFFNLTPKNMLTDLRMQDSIVPRIDTISWALDSLQKRDIYTLITGSGSGSYENFSPKNISAHNMYTRLLYENGILGLLTIFIFLSYIYKRFRNNGNNTLVTHALVASIIGILIHGIFIDTLHFRHFWILLGLL